MCVCGCVLKPEHVVLLTDRTEQKSPHENTALFIYHSARAYRGLQNKQLKDVMLTERDNHCVFHLISFKHGTLYYPQWIN